MLSVNRYSVNLLRFHYVVIGMFFLSFVANVVMSFWTIYRVYRASVIEGIIFIVHVELSGFGCQYLLSGPSSLLVSP